MASWNSVHLEVLYNVLGWVAKSVVGLNFDFLMLNLTKHSSYLIYNASLFFSSTVRRQYHERFGFNELIPVAANDVAFSMHAVLLTAFTLFQVAIYDNVGTRKSLEFPSESFLLPGYSQQFVCVSLYPNILGCGWYPSASKIQYPGGYDDHQIHSSGGFESLRVRYVGVELLCESSCLRTRLDSNRLVKDRARAHLDQNSWVNFYGNIGKTMISLVSIFFDILFIIQHYVLYRHKKDDSPSDPLAVSKEQLLQIPHSPHSDNV
ncbi:hypothetical protein OROMI_000408 [Orobanche minor]